MSFILDALKKADAERNLGNLPGIHTRQTAEAAQSTVRSPWSSRQKSVALAFGAAIVVMGIGAWQLGGGRQAPVAATAALSNEHAGMAGLQGAGGARPAAPGRLPMASGITPANPDLAAMPAPATELPVPKPLATEPPVPKPQSLPRKASPAAIAAKDATPAPGKSLPAAERANVMTLVDLPPAIQREIPPLAISGSMYSANPADRMLLVDKRMLHEGDEVAPGLVLDSVLPKGAILRYKGHAFRVSN